MKFNRTNMLMTILLIMVSGLLLKTLPEQNRTSTQTAQAPKEDLLPGNNEIKDIKITVGSNGNLYATVSYYFTGDIENPQIRVFANSPADLNEIYWHEEQISPIQKGHNTVKLEIVRPYEPTNEFISKKIIAYFIKNHEKPDSTTTKKEINHNIPWPTQLKYENDRALARKSNEELYTEAVDLIDRAEDNVTLSNAKLYLERILINDSSYIAAYPELARIAMKTKWGPEGLEQAESYLNMGLALKPDHANSHVLLGYVYTHQEKFDTAQQEFETAAKIGTDNLWLWANWGQLYRMRGDSKNAIDMYEKAVSGARPFNTYDRARLDAYRNLLDLLGKEKPTTHAEQLYAKRADEFSNMPCLRSEYAAFMIYTHQNYEGALFESRKAMANGCNTDQSRQIMAIANYVGWMRSKEDQRAAYLSQAQLLFPTSPNLIYTLASDTKTIDVLENLIKTGVNIDTRDNKNLNALSYALSSNNVDTVQRLVKAGAKLTDLVGEENYPAAAIPFFYGHVESAQLVLGHGINPSTMIFQGKSLVDYAERSQNPEIIKLIRSKIKT